MSKLFAKNAIAYTETGNSNKVILFIHGMGCDSSIWNGMIAKLSKTYKCICIDLPEHGATNLKLKKYTLSEFVDIIHDFIVEKNLQHSNLHLIAHSMGAQISIILAIRFPTFFQSLILLAPAGVESYSKRERSIIEASTSIFPFFNNEEQMKTLLNYSWFNNNSEKLNSYLKYLGNQPNFSYKLYFETIKKSIIAMLKEPVDEFLKSITIPTLIIFGEADRMIPNPVTKRTKTIEIAKNAHKLIKDSTLVTFPKKGHFLPFEAENECVTAIIDFMD